MTPPLEAAVERIASAMRKAAYTEQATMTDALYEIAKAIQLLAHTIATKGEK